MPSNHDTRAGRRRFNQIDGQFSPYLIEMLEHPSFRVLSLTAHRVLFRICIEHAHHGGKDNGKLPVTYEQFVEYGIHRAGIKLAIRELVALGIIKCKPGRAGNADSRTPSLYQLTFRPTPVPMSEEQRAATEQANQPLRWSQRTPTHIAASNDWKGRATTLKQAAQIAAAARRSSRRQNQNPVPENALTPVPETGTGRSHSPVPETGTTGRAETITTSISRMGRAVGRRLAAVSTTSLSTPVQRPRIVASPRPRIRPKVKQT